MAAGKWKLYDSAKQKIGAGTIDLDSHNFKIALFTSASNANTLTNNVLADLTNQVTNANGYTTGGNALGAVVYTNTAGTSKFDSNDTSWTAAGGSITARFAVIYDDTNAGKDLLAVMLLDAAPADVVATDGNNLNVNMNASGIFTVSGATTD